MAWDTATKEDLTENKNPYLLITRKPLRDFSPVTDEFIILNFPEALDNSKQYIELFDEIAREISAGRNIFEWNRSKSRKQIAGRLLKRLVESVEMKPGALGFSIDLKKLLAGK